MRPKEQRRIGSQVFQGRQNTPEMIGLVITADGEDRVIARDNAVRALKSLELGPFYIHFNKRDALAAERIVERDARDLSA